MVSTNGNTTQITPCIYRFTDVCLFLSQFTNTMTNKESHCSCPFPIIRRLSLAAVQEGPIYPILQVIVKVMQRLYMRDHCESNSYIFV